LGAGERFLNVRFAQREATHWAPAGHEVAWVQLAVPATAAPAQPQRKGSPDAVSVREDAGTITLSAAPSAAGAATVEAVFDKHTGRLVAYGAQGANLLAAGPELNVWRGATDNDGIKLMLDQQMYKPLTRWLSQGLDHLEQRLEGIHLSESEEGLPCVEIVHAASGRGQWDDFTHTQRCVLQPDGELAVSNHVQLGADLQDPPRIGVQLALPAGLEALTWYGRGPWENYSDRQAGALVGVYEGTVADQYVPYVMPQENGAKTGVRRLRLTDAGGRGVEVSGDPLFSFTASHFSAGDLYAARHTTDLQPRAEVLLALDAAQRGLGTASCGPDTLERHRLLEREYEFTYRLRPIGG
jgi:beta-galactosidase